MRQYSQGRTTSLMACIRICPIFMVVLICIPIQIYAAVDSNKKLSPLTSDSQQGAIPMTLEQKLLILERGGFKLAESLTVDNLLELFDREDYEENGFLSVVSSLATGLDDAELGMNACVNLATFDLEAIYGDGSYVILAERMLEMTKGALVFENMQDHVDEEHMEAWFSFTFHGEEYKFDLELEEDWTDITFFGIFCGFLEEADPDKIYVIYDKEDQAPIIGCVTRDEFSMLLENNVGFKELCSNDE